MAWYGGEPVEVPDKEEDIWSSVAILSAATNISCVWSGDLDLLTEVCPTPSALRHWFMWLKVTPSWRKSTGSAFKQQVFLWKALQLCVYKSMV